jgi:hypothetical protein
MDRQGLEPCKRVAYYEYDYARDGGAIGTVVLRGPKLPAGAVVTDGKIHVKTAVTSSGAVTMTLGILTAVDVLASTLKGAMTLDAILDVVPVRTAATSILATAGAGVTLTIGVAAITAGKFIVALEYF